MDRVKRQFGAYKALEEGGDESEGVPLVEVGVTVEDAREDERHAARPALGVANASLLSRVFFLWVGPLLSLGRTRQLDMEDLFELPESSSVDKLTAEFDDTLRAEVARGEREQEEWGDLPPPKGQGGSRFLRSLPPVFWALQKTFGAAFFQAGCFKLCSDLLQFLPAVVLADYLLALSGRRQHIFARMGSTNDAGCAAGYAVLLFVFPVARTLVEQAYFMRVQLINMGVKASLQTAVYKKAVRLSNASKSSSSSGEILNLMQMDANRISELVTYLHVIWSALLQTIGYVTLLYTYIGWSVLGGLTAMFALVPIQNRVFGIIAVRRKLQLQLSDKRVKMQNEAMSGIKIIKLNGWETSMLAAISAVRDEELAVARNLAFINAFVSCLITTLPTLVAVSAFALYSGVAGGEMVAWVVFPALSLFNQLRFPIMFLPRVLSSTLSADALVSLKRIQRYVALVETESAAPRVDVNVRAMPAAAALSGGVLASIRGGSFHFSTPGPNEAPFLKDIDLELRAGTLTVVVGPVGAGKSALAAALLGELALCSGAASAPKVNGRVAYVAQTAWVQSITLKENVLFGLPYDAQRYAAAVQAACLGPDIVLLPNGHDTEIGEKGITLSGGQRARVSIARAVYADADVYILDDPLSALDAHVGRAVFNDCVRGALREKAVLLITHALSYAADADAVLVMDGGRIAEAGSFATLMASGGKLATLIAEHGAVADDEAEDGSAATLVAEEETAAAPAAPAAAAKAAAAPGSKAPAAKMIENEKREEGSVKWDVFASYAHAFPGGWRTVALLLVLNIVKQLASIGSTLWLAVWSGGQLPGWHDAGYLSMYALISVSVAVVTYIKSLAFTYCGIKAAGSLHARLLKAVLTTRLTWFDVTPLGRILQRFSKDTDTIDNSLPAGWNSTTEFVTGLLTVILAICVIEPTMIPILFPIGALYFRVQAYFRSSYREIKRLDGISGSPIFSHFSETLAGLQTIRAFGHQDRFIRDNLARVSTNQRAFYAQRCACDRWLPVRLETVGNLIVLSVALLGVPYAGSSYAAFVGLVLSFSLDLTGLLSWVIRQWSETEAGMVSVERVSEYAALPSEEDTVPAARAQRQEPPPGWPRTGALRLEHLTMRYQPSMPLVLRDVSADIAAGEKVGVVGRTGSGKSSLLVALWRLVEPEQGRILLDGVDTSRLALSRLRACITCIPQDAVMFSGTVRHNLNPVGATGAGTTDAALWSVLDAVGMKRTVQATGLGLDAQVAEFGESYSAGERQLISLARALLRDSRVVCLDEATASVDLESDARMQAVIAERFKTCTVVVIAHRLATIIGSDRIMCMAAGELVAHGSPAQLLADPTSVFSLLVNETGEAAALRQKAAAQAQQ